MRASARRRLAGESGGTDVAYIVRTFGFRVDSLRSRDVIRKLKKDGLYEVAQRVSHKQFKHPRKTGRVTVPHPKLDLPKGTLRSIEK